MMQWIIEFRIYRTDTAAIVKIHWSNSRHRKKKILQRCAAPLYLIPSNPCNAILKYSFIGTRILISLTWRTRCIRNAPCRCTAYVVSSFSAVSSGQQYTYSQPQCYLSTNTHTNRKSPELHRLPSLFRQLEWKRSRVSSGLISSVWNSIFERGKKAAGRYVLCAITIHTSRRALP